MLMMSVVERCAAAAAIADADADAAAATATDFDGASNLRCNCLCDAQRQRHRGAAGVQFVSNFWCTNYGYAKMFLMRPKRQSKGAEMLPKAARQKHFTSSRSRSPYLPLPSA